MNKWFNITFLILFTFSFFGQEKGSIEGKIVDHSNSEFVPFCHIQILETNDHFISDPEGYFKSPSLEFGSYHLVVSNIAFIRDTILVQVDANKVKADITLKPLNVSLGTYNVSAKKESVGSISKVKPIEGVVITYGKKTEIIAVGKVNGNLANNSARQIYSTIPGLNIWESDGAGIQLGIGGRGLSPSRTANYNTRQNEYDISADALGYPESYYSPPAQAIEQIQFIKGAGALQFGPQFGGVVNFKLKQGHQHRLISGSYQKSFSSFKSNSTYFDFGGTNKRLRYFFFFNHKAGNEWRPNSNYEVFTGGINISYYISENTLFGLELTKMNYLAQQSGGLTDYEFNTNPQQSKRDRNWFFVDWNLWSASIKHTFNSKNILTSKVFGLYAQRKALGYLGQINRTDPGEERNLIEGTFDNIGIETRFLKLYDVKNRPQAFVAGFRLYKGFSIGEQGYGNKATTPDFYYVDQSEFEHSKYEFPSFNAAFFLENIFRLTDKTSIIPGLRWEYISTEAIGSYNSITTDLAGNVIGNDYFEQSLVNKRSFVIGGLGLNHKIKGDTIECYANFSQNYRSINFTDMQISNPNFKIDPNLKDETGYNADLGIKGYLNDLLYYDVSAFFLHYNNRIGTTILKDSVLFNTYQYRTNISESISTGVEGIVYVNWSNISHKKEHQIKFSTFLNYSYTYARYTGENELFKGNFVELVPPVNYKTGFQLLWKNLTFFGQYSWVHWQYSDASNSLSQPNAVNGIIPTYSIVDAGMKLKFENVGLNFGVNNILNELYFTRRATSYPGPGIIPSAPRNFYATFVLNF
ncbi:MAG: TonB-dependent receptor [Flavobacteriales bacterium]|nr:TonB-dependent receptor [Flavobacteriales bacterium]